MQNHGMSTQHFTIVYCSLKTAESCFCFVMASSKDGLVKPDIAGCTWSVLLSMLKDALHHLHHTPIYRAS